MTTSSDVSSSLLHPDSHEASIAAEPTKLPLAGAHIGALDGIRGLAIILVLFFHFGNSARGFGFSNLLLSATKFGWIGVDLFFVLSGFLITGILYDSRKSPHYFRNFYARRALRIFPLYYLALAFVVVLSIAWPTAGIWGTWNPLWIAFYLTNLAMTLGEDGAIRTLAHFWSLAIEEHFYLLWPLIVLHGTRLQLMGIAAGFVAFSLILRIVLTLNGIVDGIYIMTPTRFDSLAVGAICSLAVRRPSGIQGLAPVAWAAMLGGALAVLAIILLRRSLSPYDEVMQTIGYTLLAVTFAGVIVVSLTWRTLGSVFNNSLLRWFGRYSYGIYVWHVIVNMILFYTPLKDTFGIEGPGEHILYMLFSFGLILLISYASYHLWEKPFLMLKSRFS